MTQAPEMPERIWAWMWQTLPRGQWCIKQVRGDTEYRRADLPPTDAECLRNEKVRALVEVMRSAIAAIDAAYDGPDDNGRYSTRERAALAALEQEAGRG